MLHASCFCYKVSKITNLMSANAFYILCQDRDIIDSRLCKLFPWHQNKIKMQMIKDATSHWPYYEVEWAKLLVRVSKWSETSSTSFLQNFVKFEAIRYLFQWNISRSVSWRQTITRLIKIIYTKQFNGGSKTDGKMYNLLIGLSLNRFNSHILCNTVRKY